MLTNSYVDGRNMPTYRRADTWENINTMSAITPPQPLTLSRNRPKVIYIAKQNIKNI